MNLKQLALTAALSTAIALPAFATELDQSTDSALQDHNTLQAKSEAGTKSSGTCWIYLPGFGWIYICGG